ncbi:hypothetical protein CP985_05735 [Malaciobacter mytili LMG 24559]|uniref:Uncharacterized protein n=1 Tax=Malaciobacter mytili LMG 24559 TaxID=1032238 RepID=A0AAX2AHL3_9BACT|nr:hypothetical protein [Malaciobacter mytili]AXH14349.1 hypothetical protein AMYT_0756 [Malaciobacter mytili LMG 24559]RXK16075.1 hypothetical protein CP985_05735 [Malaciobacter mytili LMG 24559]
MNIEKIEVKIWKYIRRKKFFVFSDAMLVTGATIEYLLNVLAQYESKGFIRLDNNPKTITNRMYSVLKRLDLNIGNITKTSKSGSKSLTPFLKVFSLLDISQEEVSYTFLFSKSKLLGSTFKQAIKKLEKIELLIKKEKEGYVPRNYKGSFEINKNIYIQIKNLIAKKEYQQINSLIEKGVVLKVIKPKKEEFENDKYKRASKKFEYTLKNKGETEKSKLEDTYKKSSDYKNKMSVIKETDKNLGRAELVKLVNVSKATISLIIREKYPNPKKMIDNIYRKINSTKIIGVEAKTTNLKELAKEIEEL